MAICYPQPMQSPLGDFQRDTQRPEVMSGQSHEAGAEAGGRMLNLPVRLGYKHLFNKLL